MNAPPELDKRPLWERREWMEIRDLHSDWEGNPLNLLGYVMRMEDESYQRIAYTEIRRWGLMVSTIWLGTDMSFGHGGRPILFESMVFMSDSELDNREYSDLQFRHHTREEALIEHGLIVQGVMTGKSGDEIWDMLDEARP